MRKKSIEFIDFWGDTPEDFFPVPAVQNLPKWYRETSPYIEKSHKDRPFENKNRQNSTVKKCKPLFDSLSSGYILKTPVDLQITIEENSHYYKWPDRQPIAFHPVKQIPGYPDQEERVQDYPKFVHPWIIKTPPGYSVLFTTPAHHDIPFRILEAIVDTDSYHSVVTIPFYFKDPNFEGIIKAGTPMAQIIPIKRDDWKFTSRRATKEDLSDKNRVSKKINSVFNNAYKNFFWFPKSYN